MGSYQAKCKDVTGVDSDKGLFRKPRVAIKDIAKDTCGCEGKSHIRETVCEDWADPVGLVVDSGAKPIESRDTEYDNDNHEHQAELWLVDTVVAVGHLQADPVVERSGDCFADDAKDEGTQASQASFANAEVVGRGGEENAIDLQSEEVSGCLQATYSVVYSTYH